MPELSSDVSSILLKDNSAIENNLSVDPILSALYSIGELTLEEKNALGHVKKRVPNVLPYVRIDDLNNSKDAPYENKPKPAIEIGLKFTF